MKQSKGTLRHTHTHTADIVAHRSFQVVSNSAANTEALFRLQALGLRPSQAEFALLFHDLGFPDYQVLADACGMTVEAVASRMYRIRQKLRLSNPQQLVALIIDTVRGTGRSGSTFFHPDRGFRGTNEEEEK